MIEKESIEYLINSLWDTYEDIREYALQIIVKLNVSVKIFDKKSI